MPNDIFICCRRYYGEHFGRVLYAQLQRVDGYTVSIDQEEFEKEDHSEERIFKLIDQCTDFLVVLNKKDFEYVKYAANSPETGRFFNELAHALRRKKNIIQVFQDESQKFSDTLPVDILEVRKCPALKYDLDFHDDFFQKLKTQFLRSRPRNAPLAQQIPAPSPARWTESFRIPGIHLDMTTTPPKIKGSAVWCIPDINLEMMALQAGSFMMGSPEKEPGRSDKETLHRVTLTMPFWLGRHPVTQGQWESVMGVSVVACVEKILKDDTAYYHFDNMTWRWAHELSRDSDPEKLVTVLKPDHPMVYASWDDAMEFCNRLTEREHSAGRLPYGYRYTLPTEAQWEYACRAGTQTPFNTGDNLKTKQANYNGDFPYLKNAKDQYRQATTKVGSFAPNRWGLCDMHGNVWEWCSDWYGAYPLRDATDPIGPASGRGHIVRGGAWCWSAQCCRSAYRYWFEPTCRDSYVGFRLALTFVG